MKVNTRLFGEIEIGDEKILTFENGIIGFPEDKKFTLIYDEEKEQDQVSIIWLQSLDTPEFALPVMNPLLIKPDYNPFVEDEYLEPLGDLKPENTVAYVTVSIPKDIKNISVNLKAPIILNVDERKGTQLIIDDDLPVKYPIYMIIAKEED